MCEKITDIEFIEINNGDGWGWYWWNEEKNKWIGPFDNRNDCFNDYVETLELIFSW